MRILRAADYRVMPWKNGGGTTTEIAVSPEGAGLDDFDWRVSMARVEAGGSFSSFADVDRTLAVLEGEGIILNIAGQAPKELTGTTAPFSFPADVPTGASLIAGPITDLNVMTRRTRMTHTIERLLISTVTDVPSAADATLILCLDGELAVHSAASACLGPLDAVLLRQGASRLRLEPAGAVALFVVHIGRVPGNG
ncbi:HutD family protein [Mesorhizobium waimense]|uniref:HutD family protein n=1 Tax=Mesorhizobium waimense TaxID=1300307 RepID=A0A3A5KMY7_9HYPH|nr:HutD family protein [Mesorhizobium waimense]RJT37241.1 HutD family protein [Mesorhizobium waimense]